MEFATLHLIKTPLPVLYRYFKIYFFGCIFSISFLSCNYEKENEVATGERFPGEKQLLLKQKDVFSEQLVEFYIQQSLENKKEITPGTGFEIDDLKVMKSVKDLYQKRNYVPVWENYNAANNLLEQYISLLDTIDYEGLEKKDFFYKELIGLMALKPANNMEKAFLAAEIDITCTASFIKLNRTLRYGKMNPQELEMNWYIYKEPKTSPDSLLKLAIHSNSVAEAVETSLPAHPQYSEMKKLLGYYLNLKKNPDWKNIPSGQVLVEGSRSERVGILRNNLVIAGFLRPDTSAQNLFDNNLKEAVIRYQKKFNLPEDGAAGEAFIREMNSSLEDKIQQVKINMERLRWLPDELGEKYIWVNIPDFWLKVIDKEKAILEMKIIAGKAIRSTPVFSDKIQFIVFSPFWNVPSTLAKTDILPKAKSNPTYLNRLRYEILESWDPGAKTIDPEKFDWEELDIEEFPYRIRQKPGPWNAMGRVKFMFPNNFAIYLHDTPETYLFNREERAFSSGCIRVEKPVELASFFLPDLSEKEITAKMKKREEEYVNLEEPFPVHIVYFTTWISDDGSVTFRKDIYKQDEKLREYL